MAVDDKPKNWVSRYKSLRIIIPKLIQTIFFYFIQGIFARVNKKSAYNSL